MVRLLARAVLAGGLIVAAGCNNSETAPSAPAAVTATAGAATTTSSAQALGRPIQLQGTIAALQGTCPTVTFEIGSTSISTTATTAFAGAGCAALANGSFAVVDGTSSANGTVIAAAVGTERSSEPVARVRGTVSGLSGTCPVISFTVDSTLVSTWAQTSFSGAGCASLANGSTVAVAGTSQSDGSIAAASVLIAVANITPPAHLAGAVATMSGTCPALTLTVGSTRITTSATTTFDGSGCAAIAVGSPVSVEGTRQPDGSIIATNVFVPSAAQTPAHVAGAVSALSGSCPTLTFTVANTSVSTTSATVFDAGGCNAIADGGRVLVEGATQSNGSITATRVGVGFPGGR